MKASRANELALAFVSFGEVAECASEVGVGGGDRVDLLRVRLAPPARRLADLDDGLQIENYCGELLKGVPNLSPVLRLAIHTARARSRKEATKTSKAIAALDAATISASDWRSVN